MMWYLFPESVHASHTGAVEIRASQPDAGQTPRDRHKLSRLGPDPGGSDVTVGGINHKHK